MTVVNLNAEIERRAEEAFNRYIALRRIADQTLAFADGKAAALAFHEMVRTADAIRFPPACASDGGRS